jgi:hypothetical protein
VGHDARRGEQDLCARERLRALRAFEALRAQLGNWEMSQVDSFFKIVAAGPAFFVSAWLLML